MTFSLAENEERVRDFFEAIADHSDGRVEGLSEFVTGDVVNHNPVTTEDVEVGEVQEIEAFGEHLESLTAAFPDVRFEIEDMIAVGRPGGLRFRPPSVGVHREIGVVAEPIPQFVQPGLRRVVCLPFETGRDELEGRLFVEFGEPHARDDHGLVLLAGHLGAVPSSLEDRPEGHVVVLGPRLERVDCSQMNCPGSVDVAASGHTSFPTT